MGHFTYFSTLFCRNQAKIPDFSPKYEKRLPFPAAA